MNHDVLCHWKVCPPGTVYRVPVYLVAEDDGRYSVIAATLPGVASRGDTVPESLANVREALTGALECYRDCGEAIPWQPVPERIEATARPYWVRVQLEAPK